MKQARIYRNKKAQAQASRRYGIVLLIAVSVVIVVSFLLFIGYWPGQRYAYMESDPIHQPYPGVYAVVSRAPWHFSQSGRNQRLAGLLAKDLGYKYFVQLEQKDEVFFSSDFLDGWPIAMQVIEQDFATRPILEKQQTYGYFGLYYFFNSLEQLEESYLLAQYMSDSQPKRAALRPFWSKLKRNRPLAARLQRDDSSGIVTLIIWDSAMTPAQRRSPFSTLIQAAQEYGQGQGYDGFIPLSYRYIREHQLDFDVFFVRQHQIAEDLEHLAAQGFNYTYQDVFFFV